MTKRGGIGRAGWCVVLCAGGVLAQGGPQGVDPEWLERLRAADAALRAELQELHRRLAALEARSAAPPAGRSGADPAPVASEQGAGSPEELAARLLGSMQRPLPGMEITAWRPDERLWAFDARGLLPAELAAALEDASPSLAEMKAVAQELLPYLQDTELAGVAVRRRARPRTQQGAEVGVAEIELALLFPRGRKRTLQLTALEVQGRWRVVQLAAPWLVSNARMVLGVLGRSKGWSSQAVHEALDTEGVICLPRDIGDVRWRIPGYELFLASKGPGARPRLPGLALLEDQGPPSLTELLQGTSELHARQELCEALIARGGAQPLVDAVCLERARVRLALARRAVLADPQLELVPRLGAILAEDLAGANQSTALLQTRLYLAAGDCTSAVAALTRLESVSRDPADSTSWNERGALAEQDAWYRVQWARTRVTAGQGEAARVSLWTAASAARSVGDRALEAEALAGVAESHWTVGELEQAQAALESALAAEPATAAAQALRALLALERLEPLTAELAAAAQAARRLDRWEPLGHLACVRVALASGDQEAAARALALAPKADPERHDPRFLQAATDLAFAQGRSLPTGRWGSPADRLLAEAESWVRDEGGAEEAPRRAEEAFSRLEQAGKLTLTPRQRAWRERLLVKAFWERWSQPLLQIPGVTGAALEAPGKLVVRVVDPAAEARLRASDSFSAFVGDARRCDLTVVVELKGEPIPSGGR